MGDKAKLACETSPGNDGKVSNKRNRSIAFVRALGTVAADEPSYIAFARSAILSHDYIDMLASITSPDGLRPLTEKGRREIKKAEKALSAALDYSKPFKEALSMVEDSCNSLDGLLAQSHSVLTHLDGPMPDILVSFEADCFAKFQTLRLSATCYFAALSYGAGCLAPLRNLRLSGASPEGAYVQSLSALNGLRASLKSVRPYGAWKIAPVSYHGCDCVPAYSGFVFRWSSEEEYEKGIQTERLKEINPGFAIGRVNGNYEFAGTGYIIGTSPEESFALKEDGVHDRLPLGAFGVDDSQIGQPLAMIAAFFGGDKAFCIDPQEFAVALDRLARCAAIGGR